MWVCYDPSFTASPSQSTRRDVGVSMQDAAEQLKMQTTGLQSLAAALLQRRLGKGEQCADWQIPSLSDECAPTPPPLRGPAPPSGLRTYSWSVLRQHAACSLGDADVCGSLRFWSRG